MKTSLGGYTIVFGRAALARNGNFVGVAVAALEPEYFEVLMRSVLYAPDMWVSLGHSSGQVFVTMPGDSMRVDTEWQQAATAKAIANADPQIAPILVGATGGTGEARMTALRSLSPPELHMDVPLVIGVSRSAAEVFGPWRQQVLEYSIFFIVLSAAACFGLYRGQWRRSEPSSGSRPTHRASAGRAPSSSSWPCKVPTWACGTGICAKTASGTTT